MTLKLIFILYLSLLLASACSQSENTTSTENSAVMQSTSYEESISKMRNEDIKWDGTFIGLVPSINDSSTFALIHAKEDIDSALKACLHDPERFAIAHLILSQRHPSEFTNSGNEWNHLQVTLEADGRVKYFPETDIPTLVKLWN